MHVLLHEKGGCYYKALYNNNTYTIIDY